MAHPIGQGHNAFFGVVGQTDDGHRHHGEALLIDVGEIAVHLPRFLPLIDRLQIFGVVRLYPEIEHLYVGFQQGLGQLRVLANLGAGLDDEVHVFGVALPALEPLQPLIAELDSP